MAYKERNHKTFRFGNYSFNCFYQNTRYGFRHVCDVVNVQNWETFRVSCPYYNRTWERFTYESALIKAAERLPHGDQGAVRAYISLIAENERARYEGDFERFKNEWNKLPESMKEALRSMGPVNSEEEADMITSIAAMFNLITGK